MVYSAHGVYTGHVVRQADAASVGCLADAARAVYSVDGELVGYSAHGVYRGHAVRQGNAALEVYQENAAYWGSVVLEAYQADVA